MNPICATTKPTICILMALVALSLAAGCGSSQGSPAAEPSAAAESTVENTSPTNTPDPCSGWTCEVGGVVYAQSTEPGNEIAGVSLTLIHHSNCSPTQGQVQTVSSRDGSFHFPEIFFHDTDRVQIQISTGESPEIVWDSAGQYCFYCSCFSNPLEITLPADTTSQ